MAVKTYYYLTTGDRNIMGILAYYYLLDKYKYLLARLRIPPMTIPQGGWRKRIVPLYRHLHKNASVLDTQLLSIKTSHPKRDSILTGYMRVLAPRTPRPKSPRLAPTPTNTDQLRERLQQLARRGR